MFSTQRNILIFSIFFLFVGCVSASSVLPKDRSTVETRARKVFLGYNGFNGKPRKPQASTGGELGAVFYIADAVDLAKSFTRGVDPAKDYVCLIFADADKWALQPKVWVPADVLAQRGGGAINKAYVGAVLFAPHTNAGLPKGSPEHVYQMGIRQAQIARLGVTADCHRKSVFADNHSTLDYPSLTAAWAIQTPKPKPRLLIEWKDALSALLPVY